MKRRLPVIAAIGIGAGILVCQAQTASYMAAVDVEDAERAPTTVRGIMASTVAASPDGCADGATVVVMVWANGECTSHRMDIPPADIACDVIAGEDLEMLESQPIPTAGDMPGAR